MLKLTYTNPNNNAEFILGILTMIENHLGDVYWVVKDLEIVSLQQNDYVSTCRDINKERVFEFGEKVAKEKQVEVGYLEFKQILLSTRTIYEGQLIGNHRQETMKEFIEIKILDGDLIYIITTDSLLIDKIRDEYLELIR